MVIPDWTAHRDSTSTGGRSAAGTWTVRSHRRRLDLRHCGSIANLAASRTPTGGVLRFELQPHAEPRQRHLGAIQTALELGPALPAACGARRRMHPTAAAAAAPRGDHRRRRCRRRRHAAHAHPGRPCRGRLGQAMAARLGDADVAPPTSPTSTSPAASWTSSWTLGSQLAIERHVAVFTERERAGLRPPSRRRGTTTRRAAGMGFVSPRTRRLGQCAWDALRRRDRRAGGAQLGIRFAIAQLIAVAPSGRQPQLGRRQRPHRRAATRDTCSGTPTCS